MKSAEEILNGAIEEMVNTAARRIIEIDMVNPGIVQRAIKETFGEFAPSNAGSLVMERVKQIWKGNSMENKHVCITDEELRESKKNLKDDDSKSKLIEIRDKVNSCVYCKRMWMKFWAGN